MPRGGRRSGTPGKAYGNRTDLNKPQPAKAAPGQQYGKAKAQVEAQKVVPMGGTPTPPATPMDAARAFPFPQNLPPIDAPTERPSEPLTAGAALGPGPGPEVIGDAPDQNVVDAERWRPYLPALEILASRPNVSPATRNFVRRLRASLTRGA